MKDRKAFLFEYKLERQPEDLRRCDAMDRWEGKGIEPDLYIRTKDAWMPDFEP